MESFSLQPALEIKHTATDILQTRRIDKHPQSVVFVNGIIFFGIIIESNPLGEAGTATLLD